MKPKIPILLVMALAIASSAWLGTKLKPDHNYCVTMRIQDEQGMTTIRESITHGPKFTLRDLNWVRTNAVSGDTNKTVIILNIIKLDN